MASPPAVGSDPQDLCLRGGELLLGKDALVLEGGKLLELFDLRALGGFGCGGFGCSGFIRWSGGRRGLVLLLVGRGAPLRGLGSHVGCGPGHDRGRRHSCKGSTSSQRHVNRLLLYWRPGGRPCGVNDAGLADFSVHVHGGGVWGSWYRCDWSAGVRRVAVMRGGHLAIL